jgi:hypothetical protein
MNTTTTTTTSTDSAVHMSPTTIKPTEKTNKTTSVTKPTDKSNTTITTISSINKNTRDSNIQNNNDETKTKISKEPKKIITIRINDEGKIEIVQAEPTSNTVNNKQDTEQNKPVSYLAKDLQIQQQISTTDTSQRTIAPLQLKAYWVITPEMLQDISILQSGYQPAWDATPFKTTISIDPRISSSARDRSTSEQTKSNSFYQKISTALQLIYQ